MNKKMLSAIMALAVAAGNFQTAAAAVTASAANVQTKDENTDASKNAAGTVNAVQVKASGSKTNEDPSASTQTTASSDTTTTTTTTTTATTRQHVTYWVNLQIDSHVLAKNKGELDPAFTYTLTQNGTDVADAKLTNDQLNALRNKISITRAQADSSLTAGFDPDEVITDPSGKGSTWKYPGEQAGDYDLLINGRKDSNPPTISLDEYTDVNVSVSNYTQFRINDQDNHSTLGLGDVKLEYDQSITDRVFIYKTDGVYAAGKVKLTLTGYASGEGAYGFYLLDTLKGNEPGNIIGYSKATKTGTDRYGNSVYTAEVIVDQDKLETNVFSLSVKFFSSGGNNAKTESLDFNKLEGNTVRMDDYLKSRFVIDDNAPDVKLYQDGYISIDDSQYDGISNCSSGIDPDSVYVTLLYEGNNGQSASVKNKYEIKNDNHFTQDRTSSTKMTFTVKLKDWGNEYVDSLQHQLGNASKYNEYLIVECRDMVGNPVRKQFTLSEQIDNSSPNINESCIEYLKKTPKENDENAGEWTKLTTNIMQFDDNYDEKNVNTAFYLDTKKLVFPDNVSECIRIRLDVEATSFTLYENDKVSSKKVVQEGSYIYIYLSKDDKLLNTDLELHTNNPGSNGVKHYDVSGMLKKTGNIKSFYTDSIEPKMVAPDEEKDTLFNIEDLEKAAGDRTNIRKQPYYDFFFEENGTGINYNKVKLTVKDKNNNNVIGYEAEPITSGSKLGYRVYIDKEHFPDGTYTLSISGYDKAEHVAVVKNGESDQTSAIANITVDYTAPELETTVDEHEHSDNSEHKRWYRYEDLFSSDDPVKIDVKLKNKDKKLSKMTFKCQLYDVDGKPILDNEKEISYFGSKVETTSTKRLINDREAVFSLSEAGFDYNDIINTNKVVVTIEAKSEHDNSVDENEKPTITFYVDRNAPVINNIKVAPYTQETGPLLGKVMKFGVFSNDQIKFIVNTDDLTDSGVARAELIYTDNDGNEVVKVFDQDGAEETNNYNTIISYDDMLEKRDLIFRVYDKCDRSTEYRCEYTDGKYVLVKDQSGGLNTIRDVYIEQSIGIGFDASGAASENYLAIIEKREPEAKVEFEGYPDKEPSWESKGNGTSWYKKYPKLRFTFSDMVGGTDQAAKDHFDSGINDIKIYLRVKDGNERDITDIVINHSGCTFSNKESFDSRYDAADKNEHCIEADMLKVMENLEDLNIDGKYTVRVEVFDNAGNKKETQAQFEIDQTSPQITEISLQEVVNNLTNKAGIQRTPYGFLFINPTIAVVKVDDVWGTNAGGTSGLNKIGYCLVEFNESNMPVNADAWDSQNNQIKESYIRNNYRTADINGNTALVDIPGGFRGQICAFPIDNVLNEGAIKTPNSIAIDTPAKHREDNGGVHIDVSYPSTNLKEGSNDLFPTAVSYRVRMIDNISGIRSVKCDVKSEKDLYSGYQDSFEISYEVPPRVGDRIGNGWTVAKMDNNLVTEIYKDYNFSQDDNGIEISYEMRDWAGNEPDKRGFKFTVDQTAPIINVSFQPSGSQYYKTERTATVTVTERNFNAQLIGTVIANTLPGGNVPAIGGWKDISKTEHQATITFKEGDYTFDINGKDMAGHNAIVNGLAATDKSFSIDMTDPVITDNNIFKGLSNGNDNSFQEPQTISFTVKEHNFDPDSVVVKVYGGEPGTDHTTGTLTDVTSKVISGGLKWTDSGDSHTATITVSDDGVYRIEISGKDKSGRDIKKQESPVFEIDKVAPVLDKSSPDNKSTIIYDKSSKAEKPDNIVFSDDNIDRVEYTVTAYTLKKDKDGVLNVEPETKKYSVNVADAKKAKNYSDGKIGISISDDEFKTDGIYEVKSKAYDVAGNVSDEAVHTFVVQKKSDFLVYIPGSNEETGEGLYKFDRKGIQAEKFDEIEMIAFIPQDKEFGLLIGGTEVSDDYISEVDEKDAPVINGIKRLHIKLDPSYFSTVYNDDSLDVDLALNAVAKKGSSSQEITIGHIYIDNVKPTGSFDSELLDMGFFGGYYGRKSMKIKINGVSPDIDIEQCTIELNGKAISPKKLQYNEDENAIYFTIPEGFNEIRATLVDKAGNSNPLQIVKNVYVGNFVKRFWYLFLGGGLIVAGIPTFLILKKRRENN